MKMPFYKRKKFWRGALAILVLLPLVLFGTGLIYLYQNQDSIIQTEIDIVNQGYHGEISVGATHLAPFRNFPYLSIKVDDVRVLESKQPDADPMLKVADIYVGLDLRDLIQGKIDIKKLLIEDGFFFFFLYEDGSDNLSTALAL